jgi:hypothetical protein
VNIAPIKQVVEFVQFVHDPYTTSETLTLGTSQEQRPTDRFVECVSWSKKRNMLEDIVGKICKTEKRVSAAGVDQRVGIR